MYVFMCKKSKSFASHTSNFKSNNLKIIGADFKNVCNTVCPKYKLSLADTSLNKNVCAYLDEKKFRYNVTSKVPCFLNS